LALFFFFQSPSLAYQCNSTADAQDFAATIENTYVELGDPISYTMRGCLDIRKECHVQSLRFTATLRYGGKEIIVKDKDMKKNSWTATGVMPTKDLDIKSDTTVDVNFKVEQRDADYEKGPSPVPVCQETFGNLWTKQLTSQVEITPHSDSDMSIKELTKIVVKDTSIDLNVKGYEVIVLNPTTEKINLYDTRALPASCSRINRYKDYICENGKPGCDTWINNANSCNEGRELSCLDMMEYDEDTPPKRLDFPLFTLEEWQKMNPLKSKHFLINGNWFDISGPPHFPHVSPCTDIRGIAVAENIIIADHHNPDKVGEESNYLDALLFIENSAQFETYFGIYPYEQIDQVVINEDITIVSGVGGFILAENGKVRKVKNMSSSTKPSNTGARTALGLNADQTKMVVVVIQGGPGKKGIKANEIAQYLVKNHGMSDVINFDNSGSSQLVYVDGDSKYMTLKGDYDADGTTKVYRPVPNFLRVTESLEP